MFFKGFISGSIKKCDMAVVKTQYFQELLLVRGFVHFPDLSDRLSAKCCLCCAIRAARKTANF